jgi:hypothetical protein
MKTILYIRWTGYDNDWEIYFKEQPLEKDSSYGSGLVPHYEGTYSEIFKSVENYSTGYYDKDFWAYIKNYGMVGVRVEFDEATGKIKQLHLPVERQPVLIDGAFYVGVSDD